MGIKKTKIIQIIVAAGCLTAAGAVLYSRYVKEGRFSGSSEPIPMICQACGHTCELPVEAFQVLVIQQGPETMHRPTEGLRFDCPHCGQKTMQAGSKCSRCGCIYAAEACQSQKAHCPQCQETSD